MIPKFHLGFGALSLLFGSALNAADGDAPAIDFDRLIKIVESYGTPKPPKNAKLVLAHGGSWTVMGNSSTSHDPTNYHIAFLIREVSRQESEVMSGWTRKVVSRNPRHSPAIRPFSLIFPEPKPKGYLLNVGGGSDLINVIHLAQRGEREMALMISKLIKPERWFTSQFYDVETPTKKYDFFELLLAESLWGFFEGRLYDPESEIRAAYKQLVRLKDAYPELFATPYSSLPELFKPPDTTREVDLLADVEALLTAPKPKPGSVEALLLKWGESPGNLHFFRFFDDEALDTHRPEEKILELGPSAIPELQALTGDRRFVRKTNRSGWIKDQTPRPRLGDLAQFLIKEISGGEDPALVAGPLTPEKERDYLKEKAVISGTLRIREFRNTPLRILAKKYPEALGEIAADIPGKAKKDIDLWPLLEAIESADLPLEERSGILVSMAGRVRGVESRSILQTLAKLDPEACEPLLKRALEKIPRDVLSPYWTCEAANFTHVVMLLSDPVIWKQYLRIAKRSSVGLRMEMMNPINYAYIDGKNENLRIAFLAAFLDDKKVRNMALKPKRYDGPCAAFIFDKIEVRNFVAMKIGSLLDLEIEEDPDEFWGPEKWAAYREDVERAIGKLDLPTLAE